MHSKLNENVTSQIHVGNVDGHEFVTKVLHNHRRGKEQKAHSFDLFDAAATRRNARAPTAAMLLARSSQPDQ